MRFPPSPASAQMRSSRGIVPMSGVSSRLAPSRSWMLAGCTTTPCTNPKVSTTRWRLRPENFLPASKPRPPFFRGPHRLTVENDRTRVRIASGLLAHLIAKLVMQPIERAIITPLREGGPNRRPRGQIMRDAVPGTPRVQHIEQPVHNLPEIHRAGPPSSLRRWQERFETGPLMIGQIRGVGLARHAPA